MGTGKLRIGEVVADIEAVTFAEGVMRVTAVLGPEAAGSVSGMLTIEGEDGTVCWRGARRHDYGVKPAGGAFGPSTWRITLDADLFDRRTRVLSIAATWAGPPEAA